MSRLRRVSRSALVPYSAESMYRLVADVASYPEFLPWCTGATVRTQTATELEASIGIGLGALQAEFATRNQLQPPVAMSMDLVDGPFRSLSGGWHFDQLADTGCEVRLQLEFEFAGAIQDALFGALFEKVCNELIGAFVQRAHSQYG